MTALNSKAKGMLYRDAGVDTRREDAALSSILDWLRRTWSYRNHVGLDFGHFANVIDLGPLSIAISTDGVGTKTIIAQLLDKYDTIGIDCVAMNANDVLCVGAEPQTLVDYIAVQRIDQHLLTEMAKGLYEGARKANITITGGEVAQLPEVIQSERGHMGFDLVGTCVGTLAREKVISGSTIEPGDVVIGLPSSGIHSNGLTLARKVLGLITQGDLGARERILNRYVPDLSCTLGEELLKPSRIYVRAVQRVLEAGVDVKGLAHITSDGFLNLPRLESNVGYVIDNLPEVPPIFEFIKEAGKISDSQMYEVFNMGVGFCLVVSPHHESRTRQIVEASGLKAYTIGYVVEDPDRSVSIAPVGLRGWRHKGFVPA